MNDNNNDNCCTATMMYGDNNCDKDKGTKDGKAVRTTKKLHPVFWKIQFNQNKYVSFCAKNIRYYLSQVTVGGTMDKST